MDVVITFVTGYLFVLSDEPRTAALGLAYVAAAYVNMVVVIYFPYLVEAWDPSLRRAAPHHVLRAVILFADLLSGRWCPSWAGRTSAVDDSLHPTANRADIPLFVLNISTKVYAGRFIAAAQLGFNAFMIAKDICLLLCRTKHKPAAGSSSTRSVGSSSRSSRVNQSARSRGRSSRTSSTGTAVAGGGAGEGAGAGAAGVDGASDAATAAATAGAAATDGAGHIDTDSTSAGDAPTTVELVPMNTAAAPPAQVLEEAAANDTGEAQAAEVR